MERINHLQEQLTKNNLDSIFITSKANVFYTSNYYTDPHERVVAIFIDNLGEPVFILPAMEQEDAIEAGWKGELITYYDHENPWQLFQAYLRKSKRMPTSLGIEKDHLTVERLEQLQTIFNNTTFINAQSLLANLRVIKDGNEYSILKQAAAFADLGVKTGIEAIKQGKSELEIVAEIEYTLKKQGVREMSFSTMVLSGTKTASPHGTPDHKKIEVGDLVLFDLGVVYNGYCSDITRTVAYKNITEQQQAIYQTVLAAQQKAIEAATIGTPVGDIDQAARQHITDNGYGEYFKHRIGHGIGIDVHEFPSMAANNTVTLKEGMCFTIEPGIYVPGVGGVRIEDEVFISENGTELLTSFPKELQIIE
ncbi:M24 family metallopeptidase [Radiobacillus sp. PE A8.2]|uniref:M24 family metallopeptidase n=1 Tax=Radiobacillus sp. PE A8.2 TaxID=3380349 RepID=UPI00388D2E77